MTAVHGVELIGLTPEQAQQALLGHGIKRVRVSSQDGRFGLGTSDWRSDRVSVHLDADGKIVGVVGVG